MQGKNRQLEAQAEATFPRLVKLPIQAIEGLLPEVKSIFMEIPPLRQLLDRDLSNKTLLNLLETFPISVSRKNEKWYCYGNIRLFLLAQNALPKNTEIYCVETEPLQTAELAIRTLEELILGSSVIGISHRDKKIAANLAKNAAKQNQIPLSEAQAENWVSRIYGVDRRTVKNPPEKAADLKNPTGEDQ